MANNVGLWGISRDYADSKTLTEEKRELLFARVLEDPMVGHAVDSLSAQFISGEMLRR
jgi:ribonuclease HII